MYTSKNNECSCFDHIQKEYDVARDNCKLYFERMYKILEFSIGVVIAVIGIDTGIFGNTQVAFSQVLFLFILPICIMLLGLLFAFNAYSLAIYGNEADILKAKLYRGKPYGEEEVNFIMRKYIKTNSLYAALSYGPTLFFYIITPPISILGGLARLSEKTVYSCHSLCCYTPIFKIMETLYYSIPWVSCVLYWGVMISFIRIICKLFTKRSTDFET